MELLAWLEQTDFSTWLRESDWGHPIVLCVHAVGMAVVVGISIMFSARVLGYSKDFPLAGFDKLFSLAWFGFAINAVSGVLLFVGEPRRLLATPAFLIKMALIVLAGLAMWILMKALEGPETSVGGTTVVAGRGATLAIPQVATPAARVTAILTILLWLGAILAGRLIGYTIEPPPL